MAAGEEAAFRLLFDTYYEQLYSITLLYTKSLDIAEDLVQDIFVKIWVKREKLGDVRDLENYLFVLARNTIFDRLKSHVLTTEHYPELAGYFREDRTPYDEITFKELERTLNNAIGALPPQLRTVFTMSRLQGLSHDEIALQTGLSKQTVKKYIVRALLIIRKLLNGHPGLSASLLFIFLS